MPQVPQAPSHPAPPWRRRRRDAAPWAIAALPSLVATGLCGIPSFDLLDYHACLALSPVASAAAAELALRAVADRRAKAGRPSRVYAGHATLLLAGPLVVFALAALWIPNCAPLTGLAFYGLGPVCSAAVGVCMALCAAAVAPRWPRAAWWALCLGSMVPAAHHFFTAPQVFAYHGVVGWVGGALYEDALAPHAGYAWFRLLDTGTWVACAAAAWALLGPRSGTTGRRWGWVALGVVGAGLSTHAAIASDMGWRVSGEDVRRALGGHASLWLQADDPGAAALSLAPAATLTDERGPEVATRPPDVKIHLLARPGWRAEARLVAEDVAVRWHELRSFLGATPDRPIEVFVYPDVARKRRWMGAARVEMAKPWLRQVHLVWPGFGASITRHELAHVFAGVDAPPPFRVPLRRGFWPDAVLIEGMAVAAEWPIRMGLDPHQWSAAMRKLKLAPPMARLLAPAGFFAQSSARAYTLSGSLLRWIRDTQGPEALRRVYRSGDLEAATGRPMGALIAQWAAYVDRLPLAPVDLERARARFERPGLFVRPCTLEIGRCRERARAAWRRDAPADAHAQWLHLQRKLQRDASPTDAEPGGGETAQRAPLGLDIALSVAFAAGRAGAFQEALDHLDQRENRGRLTSLQRARVERLRGDLLLASGRHRAALVAWRRANIAALPAGARRLLDVKVHLTAAGAAGRRFVAEALSPFGGSGSFSPALRRLLRARPDDVVARYLAARRGTLGPRRGRQHQVLRGLLPALAAPWPRLHRACLRLLARDAARRGDCGAVARWAEVALAAGRQRQAAGSNAEVRAWRASGLSRCAVRLPARWLRLWRGDEALAD